LFLAVPRHGPPHMCEARCRNQRLHQARRPHAVGALGIRAAAEALRMRNSQYG
jgi:hypothetical protein